MRTGVDSKAYGDSPEVEANSGISQVEHAYDLDEKAKMSEYKADAVEAENAEHNMGVLEAVRAYPMASFWAFIMSFTIVKLPPPFPPIILTFSFPPSKNRS
jgi:SP family general alpha glucoside:H+ symporter-like MFS transporter